MEGSRSTTLPAAGHVSNERWVRCHGKNSPVPGMGLGTDVDRTNVAREKRVARRNFIVAAKAKEGEGEGFRMGRPV